MEKKITVQTALNKSEATVQVRTEADKATSQPGDNTTTLGNGDRRGPKQHIYIFSKKFQQTMSN